MIEVVGVFRDPLQGLRQLRLLQDVTLLEKLAVALEDAPRLGKLAQVVVRIAQVLRVFVRQSKSLARQFRGYKRLGEGAIAQLKDEELFVALDPEANSIAVIVKHLAGNMRSRA